MVVLLLVASMVYCSKLGISQSHSSIAPLLHLPGSGATACREADLQAIVVNHRGSLSGHSVRLWLAITWQLRSDSLGRWCCDIVGLLSLHNRHRLSVGRRRELRMRSIDEWMLAWLVQGMRLVMGVWEATNTVTVRPDLGVSVGVYLLSSSMDLNAPY